METLKLRRIQQPSRVERLLENYVWHSALLPEDAYQIRDTDAVPASLRPIISRAMEQGQVWSCWANASRVWLFTSDMSLAHSRERGSPVLQVARYSEHGELQESGAWIADSHGKWTRCTE